MFEIDEILGRRFRILSILGEGGFGEVYLVETFDDKLFALKTVRKERLTNPEVAERFKRESSIWLEFEHQNIVRAYSVQELGGRLCLQLEYVPPNSLGMNTLSQYLKFLTPDLHQTFYWALQFCSGMQHAYNRGLRCHRDIKPDNILISPDRTLKITDFGIGKISNEWDETRHGLGMILEDNQLTQGIIGTLSYMSPEQLVNSANVDHLSDIYSFGIVLYELVGSGKRPFSVISTNDGTEVFLEKLFLARKNHDVRPLDSAIWPIISKCLQFGRDARYQSFADLVGDLTVSLKEIFREKFAEPQDETINIKKLNDKVWSQTLLGNFNLADKFIEESYRQDSINSETLYYHGNLEVKKQNFEYAISLFKQSISIKETPEIWVSLGIAHRKLGQFDEAIKCYLKAISLNRNLPHAWYNLGVCNMKQTYYEPAIIAFDATLKIDPSFHAAWLDNAICHEQLNRHEKAIELYQKALSLNPNNPLTFYYLGILREKIGDRSEAINCYINAIEIQFDLPLAHFNLAVLCKKENRLPEARQYVEAFLLLSSDDERIRRTIAEGIKKELAILEQNYNPSENP